LSHQLKIQSTSAINAGLARQMQITEYGATGMVPQSRFGLSCALALPLTKQLEIDYGRLTAHARRCLETGCSSVTVFGTTGEGASVSLDERHKVLDALSAAGVRLSQQVLGGVAAASVGEAAQQARALIERDCRGVLLAPPFYYKGVTEDGLYKWFSQVFAATGDRMHDVFLYNIPSVTHVLLPVGLIRRLKADFPKVITGVKDSGSDWAYTENLLSTGDDLLVLIGNESHLAAGIRKGAKGAISGLANLCPEILSNQIAGEIEDSRIAELSMAFMRFPFVAAVKAVLAHRLKDPAWSKVRPPLEELSEADAADLVRKYDQIATQ
jgi:4-hydroxy-tetrahydrodipicolinate synthase